MTTAPLEPDPQVEPGEDPGTLPSPEVAPGEDPGAVPPIETDPDNPDEPRPGES